jgi:hypothetical protein
MQYVAMLQSRRRVRAWYADAKRRWCSLPRPELQTSCGKPAIVTAVRVATGEHAPHAGDVADVTFSGGWKPAAPRSWM